MCIYIYICVYIYIEICIYIYICIYYIYVYIRNHTEVDRIWSLHTYSHILVSFFFECSIYFRNARMTIGGNGIRAGISDGRIRYLRLEVV